MFILNGNNIGKMFREGLLLFVLLSGSFTFYGQIPEKVNPEDVGLSSERLLRINERMRGYIDENKLAGIVTLVARKGKIAHFETFGYADIESEKKMEKDAIFRIYSMTKPIVSVGLMMLYEQGEFQLTDPVSKYIPEVKEIKVLAKDGNPPVLEDQKSEIRIVDLLRHTSGLGYGWGPGGYVDSMYNVKQIWGSKDLTEFVNRVKEIPLYFQPGTKWRYGISVDIIGLLIERISGLPLDKYLEENIFVPLKMNDTGFEVPNEKTDRFTTNYAPKRDGGLRAIDLPSQSPYTRNVTLFSGGGGLLSTTTDYFRFCQMLLDGGELNGKRILGSKTVEMMTMDHTDGIPYGGGPVVYPRKGAGFGLGFQVTTDPAPNLFLTSEGQYGWAGAAGTYFRIDPKEEMIIILMLQIMPNNHLPIHVEFNNLSYQAIID
ncbi:MAG: beta-lactamase family protein [Bacteroidales bacterium]|nr:beta-lactamase family protein [Bacteroidales bacterium]